MRRASRAPRMRSSTSRADKPPSSSSASNSLPYRRRQLAGKSATSLLTASPAVRDRPWRGCAVKKAWFRSRDRAIVLVDQSTPGDLGARFGPPPAASLLASRPASAGPALVWPCLLIVLNELHPRRSQPTPAPPHLALLPRQSSDPVGQLPSRSRPAQMGDVRPPSQARTPGLPAAAASLIGFRPRGSDDAEGSPETPLCPSRLDRPRG